MISFPRRLQHTDIPAIYELKSVVSHYGGTHSGHYKTFINRNFVWYELDDESVRIVSFEEAVHVS